SRASQAWVMAFSHCSNVLTSTGKLPRWGMESLKRRQRRFYGGRGRRSRTPLPLVSWSAAVPPHWFSFSISLILDAPRAPLLSPRLPALARQCLDGVGQFGAAHLLRRQLRQVRLGQSVERVAHDAALPAAGRKRPDSRPRRTTVQPRSS